MTTSDSNHAVAPDANPNPVRRATSADQANHFDYLKADGTGNDFIVVLDVNDEYDIPASAVQRWCDREHGIGADGLLRVVRRADGSFFMDYRNADGSLAETCGNGLRVVGHVLRINQLLHAGEHVLGTRGGDVAVNIPASSDITVEMGRADERLDSLTVQLADGSAMAARAVFMPNPHAVVFVSDVSHIDLTVSPSHEPALVLPDGANYEFIEVISEHHIRMRVFERGVGETKSCGSGACAAAVVAAHEASLTEPWQMRVDVPGGTLMVTCSDGGVLSLTGPAQVTATGTLSLAAESAGPRT